MLKVQASPGLAGKSVNLPHTEHFVDDNDEVFVSKSKVSFDVAGYATVNQPTADALTEFYGNSVRVLGPASKADLKALSDAQEAKAKVTAERAAERVADAEALAKLNS